MDIKSQKTKKDKFKSKCETITEILSDGFQTKMSPLITFSYT